MARETTTRRARKPAEPPNKPDKSAARDDKSIRQAVRELGEVVTLIVVTAERLNPSMNGRDVADIVRRRVANVERLLGAD
jgi:hypothetical protein